MITVIFPSSGSRSHVRLLRKVVAALKRWLPENTGGVITVVLVGSAEMKHLNKTYAGKPAATDVLSFNYQENGGPPSDELGDVVINLELAQAQAAAAGTDVQTEIALLGLHGILHILGYDHQTPSEQKTLDRIQKQLMGEAGLTYRHFGWE